MSFNTQPTRVNELLVDSDQTWVSRKSFRVPSDGTGTFDGALDASSGTFFLREFTNVASVDSTQVRDGEFAVMTDASTSSSTLAFRSGATTYEFAGLGQVR